MAFLNTDVPELSGSDTAVCLDNLDTLSIRRNRLTEAMLAELSELADAIIRDAEGDPDTVDSILLSLQGAIDEDEGLDRDADHRHRIERMAGMSVSDRMRAQVAEVNRDLIGRISLHAGVHMRLILYRLIAERMPVRMPRPSKSPSLPESSRGRIAYMAGAFADKAYARLSPLVPHARAATFHSFVDACEEVSGGLCEYGILPLENTQNGKLSAFSHLILRYGLYIVAVCDLENGVAEGQYTRFALLRKADDDTPATPLDPPENTASPLYIELLHTTDSPSLTELLHAAAFCGLTLVRVDTLPRFEELDFLLDGGGMPQATLPVCCVLDAASADLHTFRRFLALEVPDNILMGIYHAH